MDDAASLLNTIGPMALPIFFFLWDFLGSVAAGIFVNVYYQFNPPLIFGFNPGWAWGPFWGGIQIRYWVAHWKSATKADWITKRYWVGKRHFENDLKLDGWNFVGRSVRRGGRYGVDLTSTSFKENPHLFERRPEVRKPPGKIAGSAFAVASRIKAISRKPDEPNISPPVESTPAKKDDPWLCKLWHYSDKDLPSQDPSNPIVFCENDKHYQLKYSFVNKPHLWMKKQGVICDKVHYANGDKLPEDKEYCKDKRHFVDVAGDLIYEFYYRSRKFPLALICLPDIPERMLSFTGNTGIVVDGGLLFETEHIAAVSFVRCEFTQTREIPFVPVGVLTDCANIAQAVTEQREIVYAGAEAVAVAAVARDTFHTSEVTKKWQDAENFITILEKGEKNMEKTIARRVATEAKADDKVMAGVRQSQAGGRRGPFPTWAKALIVIAVILAVVAVLRFA